MGVEVSTTSTPQAAAVRDFSLPQPTAYLIQAAHGHTTWTARGSVQSRNSSGPIGLCFRAPTHTCAVT